MRDRKILKRMVLKLHRLGLRIGVQILPNHYYSPVPDLLELERTRERWAKRSELPGLHIDLDEQIALVRKICSPYEPEFRGNATYREATAFGPGYGYIEAQALHAVVRHYKPKRIVEAGSGASTLCMLRALERNAAEGGPSPRLVSIEPHPNDRLRSLPGIELVAEPVQTVSLDVFTSLGENDLLFIDSSHAVKPGGDVNHLVLEVLPRLAPGVVIHFHDINFPYDYQRDVAETFLHWAEVSLLRAYLAFNARVEVMFSMSLLHYDRPEVLREVFPEYKPQANRDGMYGDDGLPFTHRVEHFPSSIYLRVR